MDDTRADEYLMRLPEDIAYALVMVVPKKLRDEIGSLILTDRELLTSAASASTSEHDPNPVVEAAKALLEASRPFKSGMVTDCDLMRARQRQEAFDNAWDALRTALPQAKEGGGAESGPTPL